MTVSMIPRSQATSTTWSGGTTTEFFIYPKGSSYKERRFDVRISSATVDLESSDWTLLPGFNRIITPLKGGFTLTYQEKGTSITLKPLEEDFLDGGWHTHSVGKAVDFNVMYKKGLHATYSVIKSSKRFGTAKLRFVYVPFVTEEKLAGSTLNGKPLTPDTLYVSDDGSEKFELNIRQPVSLIYVSIHDDGRD